MSPTRYCQRWPQNPSNRCELFDVQQPPELTVELSTTQPGRMQEHSSSPSTERFPSQRTVQSTGSGKHRIWLAELQVCFSPRATMERGLVPRQLCRAGCARPAATRQLCRAGCAAPAALCRLCRTGSVVPPAPRWLCRVSWVCLCGVAASAAARTHQVLCHSVRFTGVKRATASIIPTIEHAITNVVDF